MAWIKITEKNLDKLYGYNHYDKYLFSEFLKNNHILSFNREPRMVKWEYFLTKGKDVGLKCYNEGKPPRNDHGYSFKNDRQEVFYVYQPYFSPEEIEEDVKSWAESLNLNYKVLGKNYSWYNRDNTCLIIIYSRNTTKPII